VHRARLWASCLVVLGTLVIVACGERQDTTPEAGGTMRIGVLGTLGHLSPVEPLERLPLEFLQHVTPPLGWVDPQGRVRTRAATEWREQQFVWDFFLSDLIWEDGAAVVPQDFLLTWRVCQHPSVRASWGGRFDFMQDVQVPNDTTLRIFWNHLPPNRYRAAMLFPLPSHRLGMDPDVRAYRQWPVTQQPLSCGPFRVEESTGTRLRLSRNATWTRTPSFLDTVQVWTYDEHDALHALQEGQVDLVDDVSAPAVASLRGVDGLRTFAVVGRSYTFLAWNLSDSRARDHTVRWAAAQAVDIEALIEATTLGQGDPARGPLLPIQGFADTTRIVAFDPDAARRALRDAGWGDSNENGILDRRGVNLHFEILVDEEKPLHVQLATLVAEDLQRVGIGAQVLALPTLPFLDRVQDGRFETFIGQWFPDLDANVEDVWRENGFLNYTGYANATADSLIRALRYETQSVQRERILVRLQRTIYADQPYLFLLQPPRFTVLSTRVRGVDPNVLSTFWNLPQWWIPRRLQ
jgi:peptide/nickel transport system substrate-binding protein